MLNLPLLFRDKPAFGERSCIIHSQSVAGLVDARSGPAPGDFGPSVGVLLQRLFCFDQSPNKQGGLMLVTRDQHRPALFVGPAPR